jgi:radical SAM superfamily enzyme YgiQ (UPF0313 family)
MKNLKILMIEPKSPGKHIFSRYAIPRLGLPILGTIAKRLGHDVRIVFEEQRALQKGDMAWADAVCVSTITSTAPAAYRFADQARQAGAAVIIGGPHATFLPEEGLQHADFVMRGEAEESFPAVLEVLSKERSPAEVPGLSFRLDGEIRHNPLPERPTDMDRVPIADFSLVAGMKGWFHRGVIPIQTSRGCPHHCSFCSVTPMFGHRMRYASNERVAEELERRRGSGDAMFIYDDNFCASPRRTKELLDYLLSRGVFFPEWSAQVSVRAARDEQMLSLMARAGCRVVYVGFESIQQESLDLFHKRQGEDDIRAAVRAFHRHGIRVHGMFITGSDTDTVENIRATARFAIEEDIETVQFLVLTPLPGSAFFTEMEQAGRIQSHDWSLYDAHHAVFQPRNMSVATLMEETMNGMAKVYAWRHTLGLLLRGKVQRAAIRAYAANQVRRWRRENRALLKKARKCAPFTPGQPIAGPQAG